MTPGTARAAAPRTNGALLRRCARWDEALANFETTLLAILILGSLVASLVQIGLRNFGAAAPPEADSLVRRAVLWIAFLGASLATFRGSHLAVDVAEQVLPPHLNRLVGVAAHLIAALVTALLAVAAARFVAAELAFAGAAGAAAALVMPLGFAVMTLRFLLGAARRLAGDEQEPPPAVPASPGSGGVRAGAPASGRGAACREVASRVSSGAPVRRSSGSVGPSFTSPELPAVGMARRSGAGRPSHRRRHRYPPRGGVRTDPGSRRIARSAVRRA